MGTTLDPVDEKTWLVPVDFLPPCWPHHTCGSFIRFKRPACSCQGRFFFLLWLVLKRCGMLSVFNLFSCIEYLSLYPS